MTENYRVRVRRGDFEVEVESSDKAYVESKLDDLLNARKTPPQRANKPSRTKRSKSRKNRDSSGASQSGESETDSSSTAHILGLVSQIKDSDDYGELEENILDSRNMLAKIISCLHYAAMYTDDPYLSTGQIETITDQLGIKVGMANAGNKIRDNQKYFTAKTLRKKKGQAVPYKLNRQGEQAFAKYLKGETP